MERSQDRIALIELLERDGRVRRAVPVHRWPVTLGRAFDNDVVIDDPHVAAHHMAIAEDEAAHGVLQMQVGATRNGVQLGARTLLEGERVPLPAGESWQVGTTRLRLRLPGDPVEPERPLGLAVAGARPWVTVVAALALWALVLMEHGTNLDPGSALTDWLLPLLAFPGAVVGWCLLWATASKVFQHRFAFWPHFSIVCKVLLAVLLLDLLLPVAAFALSWEWLSRIASSACVVAAAYGLYLHGALAATFSHRWLAAGLVAALAVGALIVGTLNYQRTDRVFAEPYLATLAPPLLRVAPGVSTRDFVAQAKALRAPLDRRAENAGREDRP